MRKKQLKIETHISPKSEELNKLKANKSPNLKNIKFFKHLYKAKLEDRYRIKGISFSTHKKMLIILYYINKRKMKKQLNLN